MITNQSSKIVQISRLRMLLSEILAKISFAWKMSLIVFVLLLSILGITMSAYSGMQSLRYQLSNIYDFMLIPIVAIGEADQALAHAQYQLGKLNKAQDQELAESLATIHAENERAHETMVRYDTEWVTTLSPEFTQALRDAGKLELQRQETVALESFHSSFDIYTALTEEYLSTVESGSPDASLANQAEEALQPVRSNLQELIAINNSFADFSNVEAQAAFRQALLNGGSVLMVGLVVSLFLSYLIVVSVTVRLAELTKSASAMQEGNLEQAVSVIGRDEISLLGKTFNSMTEQLKSSFSTLESRVAERTRNLELAGEVGRTVSQVRALDVMLTDAAELIRTQFDLYYVQVYLVNASRTYLGLQAGTGHVGRELLGRSHRLPYNADSINGRAAVEKRSVVISDTTASATFKPNPLLPDTRSEMAVPLMIGERVVGVLDMQSESAGALNQDVLTAFEALAGQLAIAIQNANFLAETQQARAEVEAQAQRLTRSNWVNYLDAIHKPEETGFQFEQNKVTVLAQEVEIKANALVTPITVTGEPLGRLVVEMEGQSPIARTDELLNAVAHQVSQQIENLRLLDSAERYRLEAEEASRRLTREGWKSYAEAAVATLSYVYDLKEVRPQNNNGDREAEATGYVLPLKVRDETIGKLVIQGMEAGDGESLSLATAVAERLGAHIESLRQFEETQRGQVELDNRARQLAAVAEVSSVSSRELDVQKMLESVVHLTQRKFGLYHAHVFLYNENTQKLQITACGYKEGDEHEGTHGTAIIALDQEQSLVARSARNRQPVIVNDVRSEPGWLPNPLLPDTSSELAVPLIIGDSILGVLDVQSEKTDAFTREDANIYSTLASQISTALQNAQSFARAQQQADRESKLNIISQKIQSATTVEAVLQIAARELGHTLGATLTIAQLGLKESPNGQA